MTFIKFNPQITSLVEPNYTQCNCKCNSPSQPYGKSSDGASLKSHNNGSCSRTS